MSDPNTTPEANATSSEKKRSPIERLLVRGGIALLLILVAFEFRARQAFQRTYDGLQVELEKSNEEGKPLTHETVQQKISLFTAALGDTHEINQDPNTKLFVSEREEIYAFRGLLKPHTIYVYYSPKGANDSPSEVVEVGLEVAMKGKPFDPNEFAPTTEPPADAEKDEVEKDEAAQAQ